MIRYPACCIEYIYTYRNLAKPHGAWQDILWAGRGEDSAVWTRSGFRGQCARTLLTSSSRASISGSSTAKTPDRKPRSGSPPGERPAYSAGRASCSLEDLLHPSHCGVRYNARLFSVMFYETTDTRNTSTARFFCYEYEFLR